MKALSFTEDFSILVLSPKIDPPENLDEGSTAKTTTFSILFISSYQEIQ